MRNLELEPQGAGVHKRVVEGFRLSPQQRRLWSLQQTDGSAAYRAECTVLIEGLCDTNILGAALREVWERNEILRTGFVCLPGIEGPVQVIKEGAAPAIYSHDLIDSEHSYQEGRIDALRTKANELSFDFDQGRIASISLVTLSPAVHILLFNLSSLCADLLSLGNLVREICHAYSARLDGPTLGDQPAQYADLAQWQNELLESEETSAGRNYWWKQNFPDSVALKLPCEGRVAANHRFRPRRLVSTIDSQLTGKIKSLARKHDTSASVFLLACWQTLLWRLTGVSEFSIGMACDGRSYEELQRALGLFSKNLPLRCHLEREFPFSKLLRRVHESSREALQWQEYFSWEGDSTGQGFNGAGSNGAESNGAGSNGAGSKGAGLNGKIEAAPFFAASFEFRELPGKHSAAGLTFSLREQSACADRFNLKLCCVEAEDSFAAEFHYDSTLFGAADVRRLSEQFQTLIESALGDPESAVSELAILSGAQRQQLIARFNNTTTVYPEDKLVHQLFEEQVERTPDNVAVILEHRQLTYVQLNARANQLAHHLKALGVGPEVPVAICMERCPEMVVGLLGVLKAGGAYVPLDPAYPKERLSFMLEDSRSSVLLTQGHIAAAMRAHRAHVVCLDSDCEAIDRASEENPINNVIPANLAYVIYTSGSTGLPKGVMIEHGSLINYLCWIGQGPMGEALAHVPLTTKLTFDMCLKQLFPPLLRGGEVRMLPEEVTAQPAALLLALGTRSRFGLNCVPTLWKAMLQAMESGHAAIPRENLAYLLFGGEELSQDLVESSFAAFPDLQIWNIYGPTEATANACAVTIGSGDDVTIGRPIGNAQIYILDSSLRPVPIGVQGELYIGGAGVARGYLNRPDLTADKFIPSPFCDEPGRRLYKTGDLARYLPDGRIEFLGRSDYQVKIRGFRVELGELEAVLREHPAVRDVVILAREHAQGEKRLVAYVVAQGPARPAASDLRNFLRGKLPEYMIPAGFMVLDALPLMPNGKVDRGALPALDRALPELGEAFVMPRTAAEELLAEIWVQILGIARVGIHDNFFELGGHSLLATQVVSRIRDTFGVEMPLRRLFELPTVSGLAKDIEVARHAGQKLQAPPITPVARDGYLPLSFAQQRLWFIDQLAPGNSAYNIPAAVRLEGPLNVMALERSLNEIVRRHEALRTTFTIVDGGPAQVIAPSLTMAPRVIDLQALSENAREIEVQRLAAEEACRPFDLAHGPLLRVTLVRLGEERHVGLLTMHHIVSDGWSTGILIRELAVLYDAFSSEMPSPLSELPIQYADFANWQRLWLQGEILQTQLAYWKQQLLGIPPLLELSTQRTRPAVLAFRGAHASLLLPGNAADALKVLSRDEGATLFMTFLTAFNVLLHRYSNQDDLVVGTPIANRNHTETEGLIGFFVNTLVLRTDLSGNPTFRELVRRVREVCLAGYSHQDLPFEKLVEELHLERDLSRNPLFQVMFVLNSTRMETMELTGLRVSPIKGSSEAAHVDLTMQISETEDGRTEAALIYNTDLFDAAAITRMLRHFRILLEAAAADPDRRFSDLSLLNPEERHQLLAEWNDTKTGDSQDLYIHQLFEAQVERTPNAIAVSFEDRQLTYEELNRRANQLAHHLRSLGVGPDVLVGSCLEHSPEMIIALMGILKAGGVYVPLDPTYPNERLSFMLEDARLSVLVTQERLVGGLPHDTPTIVCLDSGWNAVARERSDNPISAVTHDNLAYVIYTSGSTGRPKGVSVPQGSLASHCYDIRKYYGLDSRDRVVQCSSMSVDLSLEQILPTLIAGARLVLARVDGWHATEFERKVGELGLTVLNLPTPYWEALAREWREIPERAARIRPRLVVVGGDVMSPDALGLWQESPMNGVRLINAYGPTEATITATAFEITTRFEENAAIQRIPIGRPLANREIYILDRYGNPVPVGVPGEVHIGGAGLARGYLNRPDLTAEKFIPNPFGNEPGGRLYRTGDMARYRLDGNVDFLGRVDHQVKIRGFRIELGEIEAALGQYPGVREAVVLAREETPGERRLVAYVVAEKESSLAIDDLRRFLKQKLPEYMMPAALVTLEAMPLMPNGKIDRQALPAPARIRLEVEKTFVAPRDALEMQLIGLWEEVLNVRPIGVRDNFFELGGHSLTAVRLFGLIENRLGKRLPLAAVFQGATIEHLATIFREHVESGVPSCLVAIQPNGSKRPLFLVHPAGGHVFPYVHLAGCLGFDQPCYGLQARGLEQGQEPHTRIEDMATHYINALRTVQPAGPYHLGGWSMGGVIAFEMAQQLHAQGQEVDFLALLDARVPTSHDSFEGENFEARLLADFIRYFGLSLEPRELVVEDSERRTAIPCARACEGSRAGAFGCRRFSSASFC